MLQQTLMLPLLALLINAVSGAPDCSKPPNLISVKNCCKIPEPNWASFKGNCNAPNLPNSRVPNPCFLECLFTETKSLDGDDLNMGNIRIMLTTLFNGNKDFVNAYALGFEKCKTIVNNRIIAFKDKKKPAFQLGPKCELKGTFYALCAHKMVFIGCPTTAWTPSKDCEAAKEYASTCEPKIGGPGGQRGESARKRNRRDISSTDASPTDASQVNLATEDPYQQMPVGNGQGPRRGGGQRWGGNGGGGGGYGYGSRRNPGMGQRQNMGGAQGNMGQQQQGQPNGQQWPMGQPPRRGQGMRQGMGPNAQGQSMPMGQGWQNRNGQNQQVPMGQQGMGQGMRQGQGQQRKGRRRMGQGQGQPQDPNYVENTVQTQETSQSRRKRDLSDKDILEFILAAFEK